MDTQMNIVLDDKNTFVMKLLHYFITEKNYTPIILQGAENEIWLENLNENYEIIRIVSGYIHNNEQFDFDMFKTHRIMRKIKRKTLSLNLNTLSIFVDLGESVTLKNSKDILCVKATTEKDLKESNSINKSFPDIFNKLKYSEEGVNLFVKITNDINKHNQMDAAKAEEVFKQKVPVITYILMAINVILYVFPYLLGNYDYALSLLALHHDSVVNGGEYYRLFTAMFMHAGIFHLLFNMYALYVIGTQLESFIGKIRYTLIYLFGGICSALLSLAFLSDNAISIGASGAIFGLMGALLYFGYHYRVYLGNVVRSQIIPLIVLNLVLGFLVPGIDNAAHIGGLIGGFLALMALGVKYRSKVSEQINGTILTIIYIAFLIIINFVYHF
ncbi:MAG: rhomboid family intramembrane serine protease [Bacilli bacterium]|nr:rhomboid family intramembrane serine protease [Bacilli bacterium]